MGVGRKKNRGAASNPGGGAAGFGGKPPPGFGFGQPGKPPPPGGPGMPSFAEFSKQFPNGYEPDFDFKKPPPNFNAEKPPDGFQDWFSNYMKDHKDEFKPPPKKPKPKKKKKNLYEILDVSPRASQTEIKKSFRRLAREMHPDKVPRALKDEFQEKFIEIANAYEILSNEKKRRRYDQTGLMGDEEEEMDDDEFGGFDSFDEAWSAFGDMGEAPPDVQPDVDDTLTSWLLFFTLGMFIFAPLGVQVYKMKNKNKKMSKFLRRFKAGAADQASSCCRGLSSCWKSWTSPKTDVWSSASRTEAMKTFSGGKAARSPRGSKRSAQKPAAQSLGGESGTGKAAAGIAKSSLRAEVAPKPTAGGSKKDVTLQPTRTNLDPTSAGGQSHSSGGQQRRVQQKKSRADTTRKSAVCACTCCGFSLSCAQRDDQDYVSETMGKNTKKIRAGIKNPNNKSQAKAAKSFIANRWWVEYKSILLAMAVLAISIFLLPFFLT